MILCPTSTVLSICRTDISVSVKVYSLCHIRSTDVHPLTYLLLYSIHVVWKKGSETSEYKNLLNKKGDVEMTACSSY